MGNEIANYVRKLYAVGNDTAAVKKRYMALALRLHPNKGVPGARACPARTGCGDLRR